MIQSNPIPDGERIARPSDIQFILLRGVQWARKHIAAVADLKVPFADQKLRKEWTCNATHTRILLILLGDEVVIRIDESALMGNYGLTRYEAALTAKLMVGKSLERAAEELQMSPQDAKLHLNRILFKTEAISFSLC
jgi:DNA-binding CsgD family transcriptional regulator